jgi:Transposase DDE domain/Insertion element 4 transposase N-terminal
MSARSVLGVLQQQPTQQRVAALKRIIPRAAVQQVLRQTGRAHRHCPRLPLWLVVWLVIGMGLFAADSLPIIFKHLQPFVFAATPASNTISQARLALGVLALRLLARLVVKLLCQADTPGAFYKGRRLMALDGFKVDVADTAANAHAFGRPQSGRAAGAFPQVRVLGLCEIGSHIFYRWLLKPCRRGEASMAAYLIAWLQADMLLLWDRNFLSYRHVAQVLGRQAHLLGRIKSGQVVEAIEELADGSYLAKMYANHHDRKKDRNGLVVRVIEYTLKDETRCDKEQIHRLLTTLLDAAAYPAVELVELYHQRWEEELSIDELKTHQQQGLVLRSKTPLGVVQEVEGLLLAHYCVRALMFEAACQRGLEPRRLSFVATLKILRIRLGEVAKARKRVQQWWQDLVDEVGEQELPPRRDRINPRVIKQKMSKWPKKRPPHYRPPPPSMPFRDSIHIE